ncbi:MAG: choice-of-anchor D domain-containing protein, partial [Flavobacteriaceae bacterium]|nr:choice-of-anchor D domain-containing protein [Flavobacteriaceae bacterium]
KTLTLKGNVFPVNANVVLTEIMYDTPNIDDEWIEICNISGLPQFLGNYKVRVDGVVIFTYAPTVSLTNNECITVALGSDGVPPFNSTCPFNATYGSPSTTDKLPNAIATIDIVSSNESFTADSVTYSTGNGGDGNGSSLHVINPSADNSFTFFNWREVPIGGSPGTISLTSPCAIAEIQLKNSAGTNQPCETYTIDFGSQGTGYSNNSTFTIENQGTIDLVISSMNISGDFSIVSPINSFSIAPGGTRVVSLNFNPLVVGVRNGALTINSNDTDEANCKINLKGTGTVPAPEIDVERNTFASIVSGSAPNIGNNTVFAETTIGSTTAPKIYYIRNEGSADLRITSLTSSNPTEFVLSTILLPLTLTPGELVSFEVEFRPNAVGNRTSTILIGNNDADENPYRLEMKGTGKCATTNLSISPVTGPTGTVVTVQGTNFGSGTTANFNGVFANVARISSTVLEVVVPEGAETGSLIVKNDLGCENSKLFKVISTTLAGCDGEGSLPPTDLFISEVTDKGTGSHTYIEIYNGTGRAVNLNSYTVAIHNNGSTTANSNIPLSGVITNNSVIVIALGGANRFDPEGGYTAQFFSSSVGINEDDNIRLLKSGTLIDLWGDTSGNPFTVASKDYTYRRKKIDITAPSTVWNASEWIGFFPVDYSDIGKYDYSNGILPQIIQEPIAPLANCELVDLASVGAQEGFVGAKPLQYSWYYHIPGQSGWTEISPSDPNYSGQRTETLVFIDPVSIEGYQFYSQVRENQESCSRASKAIRLKVNQTRWNGTAWSNGVPNSGSTAIISGSYDTALYGSFSACKLTVEDNGLLIINNSTYVEITNDLTVRDKGNLTPGQIIVKPSGSFIQINDLAQVTLLNNAKIEVEKLTAPAMNWYEYTYWSSPVVGETIDRALATAHPTRRYFYSAQDYRDSFAETNNNNILVPGQDGIDDDGNDWQFAGGMTMAPGVGYASTFNPPNFSGTGGLPYSFLFTFKGAFNNGVIKVPIYRNDLEIEDENWNFIGNPYPSAVDADAFLEKNQVLDGAIYLWSQGSPPLATNNGNQQYNFNANDYAIINGAGEVAGGDQVKPNRFIPSGQGFFVTYSNGGAFNSFSNGIAQGEVVFQNYMRTKGNGANSQFFRTRNPQEENKLWVNLTSDAGVFSQILVSYIEGATDNYDGGFYDVIRSPRNKSVAAIFSMANDGLAEGFVIQGKNPSSLNETESIPIGISLADSNYGSLKLSLDDFQGDFLFNNEIFLVDSYLNITHNLKSGSYPFKIEKGNYTDRFKIVFSNQQLSEVESEKQNNKLNIIELRDGTFKIWSDFKTLENIEIFDLQGKLVYRVRTNSYTEIINANNWPQGIYTAKVKLLGGRTETKKVLKKY